MKIQISVDARIGMSVILLCIVAAVATQSFPTVPGGVSSPATFPLLLSMVGALLGLGLIVNGIRNANVVGEASDANSPDPRWRIPAVIASIVLYLMFMPTLGFVSSSTLLFWTVMRLLGYSHKTRAMAISLVAAIVVYGIFYGVMKVPLPTGCLG